MKENKYELKTTEELLDQLMYATAGKEGFETYRDILHDARLAHELLERVQVLERVAKQAVEFGNFKLDVAGDLRTEDGNTWTAWPDLAAYLREREDK